MATPLPGRKEEPTVADSGGRGDTVVVACKVPMGIELRIVKRIHKVMVPGSHGGQEEQVPEYHPRTFTVRGPGHEAGRLARAQVAGGAALTHGVPRDFWEQWLRDNAESPLVKNHQIFAASSLRQAADKAREQKAVRSGLEPLSGPKDPRLPKPATQRGGTAVLEVDEEATMAFAEEREAI